MFSQIGESLKPVEQRFLYVPKIVVYAIGGNALAPPGGASSDENAMWIKWTEITENGEDITPENQPCILLIKDSSSYSEDADEYISKAPSWCE